LGLPAWRPDRRLERDHLSVTRRDDNDAAGYYDDACVDYDDEAGYYDDGAGDYDDEAGDYDDDGVYDHYDDGAEWWQLHGSDLQ